MTLSLCAISGNSINNGGGSLAKRFSGLNIR